MPKKHVKYLKKYPLEIFYMPKKHLKYLKKYPLEIF